MIQVLPTTISNAVRHLCWFGCVRTGIRQELPQAHLLRLLFFGRCHRVSRVVRAEEGESLAALPARLVRRDAPMIAAFYPAHAPVEVALQLNSCI